MLGIFIQISFSAVLYQGSIGFLPFHLGHPHSTDVGGNHCQSLIYARAGREGQCLICVLTRSVPQITSITGDTGKRRNGTRKKPLNQVLSNEA